MEESEGPNNIVIYQEVNIKEYNISKTQSEECQRKWFCFKSKEKNEKEGKFPKGKAPDTLHFPSASAYVDIIKFM